MKITVPAPLPYSDDRPEAFGKPSFGQTGNANFGKTFGPIVNQLQFFNSDEYDPDVRGEAEDYIEANDLNATDAEYIRRFGIGSSDNLSNAIAFTQKRALDHDTIENSTGINWLVTDPVNLASVFLPVSYVRGSMYLGKGLSRLQGSVPTRGIGSSLTRNATETFGDDLASVARFAPERLTEIKGIGAGRAGAAETAFQRPVSMAVSAQQLISKRSYTAAEMSKIVALDAAVIDGSVSLTEALNQISFGEEADDAILNAAAYTAATTAFGGLLGYGMGAALGAPLRSQQRSQQFSANYKRYLRAVSERPTAANNPVNANGEVSYAGSWFTDSVFFKAVPTPVRSTVMDKNLPDKYKRFMLRLGGDMGMVFREAQAGIASESSVFINSGRRFGDWYKAISTIDESFSRVNPTGASQFMNVPVGSYIEALRKRLGKDVITPKDWYEHIGRLVIDDVPYEKMTPEEAASVQAYRNFDEGYGKELTDIGLIRSGDIFVEAQKKQDASMDRAVSVVESIIQQNKKWMTEQSLDLTGEIAKRQDIIDNLLVTQQARGLTQKQEKLLAKLTDEANTLQAKLEGFLAKFAKINEAKSVNDLVALRKELDLTDDMRSALGKLGNDIDEILESLDNIKFMVDESAAKGTAAPHFYRIWNRPAINENRDAFRSTLMNWFREDNVIYRRDDKGAIKRDVLPTDEASLRKRADRVINNILDEVDEDGVDAAFSGYGRAGPMLSRTLNIPNSLVKDFIATDVREVMIAYTQRVAPKLEFHKAFPGDKPGKIITLEDRIVRFRSDMINDGVPQKTADKFIKNFVAVYDQVVASNVKRPDAIDSKVANVLRTATTWTFLGGSGVAALGDTASLLMDHEMKTIGRAFIASLDDPSILPKAKRELNLAGEALEVALGISHLRMLESQSRDIFSRGATDKINNGFFVANALGPVTVATKVMDGLLRGHTLIEASERLVAGKANKFEVTFLARYGITEDMAKRFTEMPFEKTKGKLYLANTEAWTDEVAVEAFRNALRAGVANRIIMGTPADKPLVMSGATYIPESLASKLPFDLPKDPRVLGYRRLESGLLTLPFTFYTYTMGALSKITANHAAGAVRNRLSHIAVAMILGGMIVKFRTPSWAWDDMDTEDKIARSFDFSGLAAIYSDTAYRGIAMAQELGFENTGPIQPKFKAEPDALGALISLGGAPADWTYEVSKATADLASGDFQDGAKGLIRMTPLIGAMVTGGVIKDTANDLADMLPNRP